MLILFIYITSLASNEIFKFNLKINIINLKFLIIIILIIIILLVDFKNLIINNKILNNDLLSLFNNNLILNNNLIILNKIYNFPLNLITIILVNYLFITLIAAVKITGIFQGPLRPKNC
jgi:NADH-ubiquinone oxidoreductase chain 6